MLPTTTDVLIAGAGPTGLTAAVSLVARGRNVTIVDDQADGQNTSRASVVYSRTLEVLEPYGVAQRLASRGIHARRFTVLALVNPVASRRLAHRLSMLVYR